MDLKELRGFLVTGVITIERVKRIEITLQILTFCIANRIKFYNCWEPTLLIGAFGF